LKTIFNNSAVVLVLRFYRSEAFVFLPNSGIGQIPLQDSFQKNCATFGMIITIWNEKIVCLERPTAVEERTRLEDQQLGTQIAAIAAVLQSRELRPA
jgi:hypothetical protein